MDVIVKARHTAVHDRFRHHVTSKLAKIEKLDSRVIRVDVEVSKERNPRLADRRERVELTIRSRGPAIRAEASADDRFAAFEVAMTKLENRLRKLCDRRKIHRGGHAPLSVAAVSAGLSAQDGGAPPSDPSPADAARNLGDSGDADAPPAGDAEHAEPEPTVAIEMEGDGPLIVREKYHRARPMTLDQALFEMELVGHDFYLFRDRDCGHPSVVYRRRGYHYGVLRLQEE